ncbi:uncharacterized protein LOC134815128 [Bolinopsis microptera]|uniref:uncharacterized protein LOC134815128 n=1 Tax=Bolinopsis microptera TaxID=2820187 RepID=UPI00307B000B
MNVEVLLLALIGIVIADNTCTYINQNKNVVSVSKVSRSSGGNTEEIDVQVGESITISCVDTTNKAFEYGAKTVYSCDEASTDKVNLPLCVDKCQTLLNLDPDQVSVFVLTDGTVVTDQTLAKSTPVTIHCSQDEYAQMFKQVDTQACELWNSDALCKKMCTLSSYSPLNTDLASTGVKPSLADPQYLQVGFSVSISCKSADYAQPLGAASSHTCNQDHGNDAIVIENCNKMCRVPTPPTDTIYQATQDQLRQGQAFTVKCTGALKFPIDQTVREVECQSDGTFHTPYPTCQATCKISATDSATTKLNKTIVGGLAQKESVEVSCADVNLLLPFGYKTPWVITCGPDNLDIDVPACQQTCAVPAAPPHATLSQVNSTRLKLREPITATCKEYYSYEVDMGTSNTKEFTCSDTSGSPTVDINDFCYVYAKLSSKTTGTAKLELKGEINDGGNYDNGDTVVDFIITGATTDLAKQAKPNVAVEVVVGSYEPLKVEVRTTSVDSSGEKKVIIITEQDIYPGPSSPPAVQQDSASSTVNVQLVPSAGDVILENVVQEHLIKYTIQYTNNGKDETIDVGKDDRKIPITLSNLLPATTYTITTTTVLPVEYGGEGDPTSSTVYTGPSQVDEATFKSTVIEDAVKLEWGSVDGADKYKVDLFENGTSTRSHYPKDSKIEYVKFNSKTTYKLEIRAIREVDINSKLVEYSGDILDKELSGPPPAPTTDQFEVTNTSDSVTVRRVSSEDQTTRTNMVQGDGVGYIVFVSHSGVKEQKTLAAEEPSLVLGDLRLSSDYEIMVAQTVGTGYGMKTFLKSFKTADCRTLDCVNCQETTQFDYVSFETAVTVKCLDENFIREKDAETGETTYKAEKTLLCNGNNQYVDQDNENQIITIIECIKQGAVIDPVGGDYTLYYIIAGVGVFLVLIIIIIIVVIRRKRTQGSYNAKKAKDTSKNGVASPDLGLEQPKTFVNDDAFFENKWDNELLRAQSGRSKATSYGSQELRMTIADSDSGITEDLENTYFNPTLYSTNCEDDTISTKSALV